MAGGREGVCRQGDHKLTSLYRPQPMLHNLTGTLRVDVDFLGTNCNKKLCLILHPNVEQKCVLYIKETVQKLQKQKHKKTPRDSQVIVIACFTSHQDSLHLAACMKHFSLQTT